MPDPERIGKYVVQRPLKRGGMGSVYLCFDPDVKRQVAVKVLRADLDPGDLRTRFKREVSAVGGLRHRNIVTIFHSDEHDGAPFLVMEYIPGETLGEVIANRPRLPLGRKLQIVDELCSALSFAHQADIVHRDVKPANVMLDADGTVKVVDFGIARTLESDLTREGSMLGTLNYMAPEQVTGGAVDARADVFAVGAVMYELLSYTQAFHGTIGSGLVGKILYSDPLPLAKVCPDLPRDIAAVAMKAMHKRPEQRYQDMRLLRAALIAASTGIDRTWLAPDRFDSGSGTVLVPPRASAAGPQSTVDGAVATIERDVSFCLGTAREAITTGEFDRAIAICRDVLEVDPQNTSAREIMVRAGAPTDAVRRPLRTPAIATVVALAIVLAGLVVLWRVSSSGRAVAPPVASLPAAPPLTPAALPARPEPERATVEQPPVVPRDGKAPPPIPKEPVSEPVAPRVSQPPPVPPDPRNPQDLPPRVTLPPPPIATPPVQPNPSPKETPPEPLPAAEPPPTPVLPVAIAGNGDPPAATPAPPPPVAPSDRQMILDVLDRYADALARRSLPDVVAIRQFPDNDKRLLQEQFNAITSWRVALTNRVVTVDPAGRRATATTTMRFEDIEFKGRPGRSTQAPQSVTVMLEKLPAGWMIVGQTRR